MPPVRPIIVSYSELDTFRQCPLKHHILYGQRWTRPVKPGSALDKGSLWHLAMETHYNTVKKWQDATKRGKIALSDEKSVLADAWSQIKPMLYDPQTAAQTDVQALIEWMYEGHVEKYGIDRQWKIVGIEHQIITPLRDARGRRTRYHLKAKMDLLVMDRESWGLWVVDHKSCGNLPTQMDLEIDDQFGLYTWSAREVGRPVLGSIHNAARTTRNQADFPGYVGKSKPQSLDQRMSRTYLNRSDMELTNLALDAYHAARAAHPPKGTERARYSSPDPRSCGWKCDVKEPHLLMRQGRNPSQVLTEYGFKIDRTRH